ncbi:MAG: glycosyltransferase [Candidatus Eremiobacteraeota bacterium]|nr:glycosyltransferase [Candidatus Eremiobacteraeota bacterium]
MMQFSVVIATRNRAPSLQRALVSLKGQTAPPSFEVIVVDNGSADATPSVVETIRASFPAVRYVWAPEPNRGKARNLGTTLARGRYLLFCDDDVIVPSNWIAAHLAAHRDTGERVVNGPIVNVPSCESRPPPRAANYSRAFLCTCNASLSKVAFDSVGGFDESFDLYGWEDTELGARLRAAGVRWKFAWNAYLWHVKPVDDETLAAESRKAVEKARMAARFLDKHPSPRARLATGAHAFNLLRARYLISEPALAVCGGIATSARAPAWLRAIARAQFLDAMYVRELLRTLDVSGSQ